MRKGENNGNWKGGISSLKTADDILLLPEVTRLEVKRRLERHTRRQPGCWLWTGGVFSREGRARLYVGKSGLLASRVAYVLYKGETCGSVVMHTCDNVLCVNPSHLVLGSNADNSADMVDKGRQAWGERNSGAKISEETARAIKEEIGGRRLYGRRRAIAAKFGVSVNLVSLIANGVTWRLLK